MIRLINIFFLIVFAGCHCKTVPSKPETSNEPDYRSLKYSAATVKDYKDLDGCTWLLELENGEKLQPMNLSDILHTNNLKVWIKYSVTNEMTVCMAGKTVKLSDVKIRKD